MSRKLISASIIVLLIGLVTSIVGLLKEIFVAHEFGTGSDIDIFYLGLTIPIFVATLFSSAINATVIPAYLQAKAENNTTDFFISSIKLTLFFLVFLCILSSSFVYFLQPHFLGFSVEKSKLVVQAGLILSPIILLQGIVSFLDGILNAEKKIVKNNLTTLLIPLGTVLVLLISNTNSFIILCLGLYVGYAAKLVIQTILVSKTISFKLKVLKRLKVKDHKKMIKEFFWLVFSSSILGVMPVIANYYASYLDAGSVASLSYANKLLSIGLVVVGIVINSVLFPHISEAIVKNKDDGIILGLRISFFCFLMFSILIIPVYILSEYIVKLLFERGQFTESSTQDVALILKYLLLYIPFYVTGLLLSRLVVSLSISRVFILGNLISLMLFGVSCWFLLQYHHRGVESLGIVYATVYGVSMMYLLIHIFKQRSKNAY